MPLMEWQKFVLDDALQIRPDGTWARGTIGCLVARQNGKTHMMRMRMLAGLFVFGEASIIAMAQTRQLALDTFKQTVDMAESVAWMRKRIKRVSRTNGQEELEVYCHHYPKDCGQPCARVRKYGIRAATSEGPRGSTADLLYIDELREIDEAVWAAARPTTRARPNSQIWTTSNAGDATSTVLNELRSKALTFSSDRVGWYEWSAPTDDVHDVRNWQAANPAMGHTVSLESLQDSAATDTHDTVQTEMLCRWVSALDSPWPIDTWDNCKSDVLAMMPGRPTWMAFDLNFRRDYCYLVTAQQLDNDRIAVFLHEFGNMSDRIVVQEIAKLQREFLPRVVSFDPNTGGHLAQLLTRVGVPAQPTPWGSTGFAIMCDQTLSAMAEGTLVHAGQDTMREHLVACARRPASDGGWRIARRASTLPIGAAVALVQAVGHATTPVEMPDIVVV